MACAPGCARPASRSTGCATAWPPSVNCAPRPTPPRCSTWACPAWTAWTCWPACARAGVTLPVLVLTARDAVPDRIKRPGHRRRRLRGQAGRPGRTGGAAARAGAPRARPAAGSLRAQDLVLDPAAPARAARRQPVRCRRVNSTCCSADAQRRPGAVARAAGAAPVQLGPGGREQRRGGAHPPPARKLGADCIQTVRGVGYLLPRLWLAAAAVTWLDLNHELDELLDAHLAQAAALLVVQQAGDFEGEDDRTVDAPSLHRYAPRAVFQVFHEGQMVLRSADAPAHPLVALAAAGGFSTVRTDGAAWRVFITRGRGERCAGHRRRAAGRALAHRARCAVERPVAAGRRAAAAGGVGRLGRATGPEALARDRRRAGRAPPPTT
jgi:hypothetical protein